MEDRLFVKIVIPEEVVTLQNIKKWIDEIVLFSPNQMRTKLTERLSMKKLQLMKLRTNLLISFRCMME